MNARMINQLDQLRNPDFRIVLGEVAPGHLLNYYSECYKGITTGDDPHARRQFWEIAGPESRWVPLQTTVDDLVYYGGRDAVQLWGERGELLNWDGVYIRGSQYWGKRGVVVSMMRQLPVTLYHGDKWDTNCAVIVPRDPAHLPAIWCFCKSPEFSKAVRAIDQSLKVTNAVLVQVPFDFDHWQKIAEQEYPNGLPEPHSEDPTQWLFKGNVKGSEQPLHVAVGRLLGYRWPEQPESDALDEYGDQDGVVCISALLAERPAADRLRGLLAAAYGPKWSLALEESLLDQVGWKGKGVEAWLRDAFFEQHCKLFHHRPFIWHIWDGRKDGFSALVNYHKLDRQKLEKLTWAYLGDWISRQRQGVQSGTPGAEQRLGSAIELQSKLKLILDGQGYPEAIPPYGYDIYIRWKPLHEQPIGWDPDLNDGVRLNIRPFMTNGGVLRWKPNINWNKDRGKNPDGSERINEIHLKLEEKRKAREVHDG